MFVGTTAAVVVGTAAVVVGTAAVVVVGTSAVVVATAIAAVVGTPSRQSTIVVAGVASCTPYKQLYAQHNPPPTVLQPRRQLPNHITTVLPSPSFTLSLLCSFTLPFLPFFPAFILKQKGQKKGLELRWWSVCKSASNSTDSHTCSSLSPIFLSLIFFFCFLKIEAGWGWTEPYFQNQTGVGFLFLCLFFFFCFDPPVPLDGFGSRSMKPDGGFLPLQFEPALSGHRESHLTHLPCVSLSLSLPRSVIVHAPSDGQRPRSDPVGLGVRTSLSRRSDMWI